MGHKCCSKQKVKRGLWSPEEDEKLVQYITSHGHGSWSSVPKLAGLQRCGKSCRLRWINYLKPDLKRGSFTSQEEQIIIDVHRILGNRWAQIAKHLPGRTDNEVKNFWNSCIKKKLISQGLDPKTHNLIPSHHRHATNSSKAAACNNNNNNIIISSPSPNSDQQQVPFSIITVNSSRMKECCSNNNNNNNNTEIIINPPILTLPPAPDDSTTTQPPLPRPMSAHPNDMWSTTHNSHEEFNSIGNFPCVLSSNIASSSSMNLSSSSSGVGLLEEICFCVNNNSSSNNNNNNNIHVLEPFEEAPRLLEGGVMQQLQQLQPKEKSSNIAHDSVLHHHHQDAAIDNNHNGHENGVVQGDIINGSFDSTSFDLEFMDATLLSASMCRDLGSMDDFAWNF